MPDPKVSSLPPISLSLFVCVYVCVFVCVCVCVRVRWGVSVYTSRPMCLNT